MSRIDNKKNEALFNFSNGLGALLCNNCHKTLKERSEMTRHERKAMDGDILLDAQFCNEECKEQYNSVAY